MHNLSVCMMYISYFAGHINPNIISSYKGFLDLFNKIHPKALLFPARLLTDNVLLFVCALEKVCH